MKLAKLITESETTCLIKGKINEEEIKTLFLDANMKLLIDNLARDIVRAKLIKPHYYRFKIQVHAQEVGKNKK